MTDHRFYVYTLENSLTKDIFYVGKGRYMRIHHHERNARQGRPGVVAHYIRQLWGDGGQVIKKKVYRTLDEDDALQYEYHLIDSLPALVNSRRYIPGQRASKKTTGRKSAPDGYVPAKVVAAAHAVHVATVIQWCKSGRVQNAVYMRNKWFIPRQYAQPPKNMLSEGYLTRQGAAQELSVSQSTIDSYAKQGRVTRYRSQEGRVVFLREDIEDLKEPKLKPPRK